MATKTDARLTAALDRLSTVPERGKMRGLTRRQLLVLASDVRTAADQLASYARYMTMVTSASHVTLDGSAVIARDDLMTVIGALSDSARVRASEGDVIGHVRVRALSRCLGDDR